MAGSMSDEESSPRRKSDSEAGSHRGSVPKRRVPKGIKKRKAKSPVRARTPLPFFEKDQYTDLEIVVDDKKLYINQSLLAYSSKSLEKQLGEDAGGKGRGGGGKPTTKELNWSHKKFDDVVEFLAYLHPGVVCDLTDSAAMRLSAFAAEYEMKNLEKDCEEHLTKSFADKRKGRKSGMVATETTLDFLEVADRYKYDPLLKMCIAESVDNPYIDSRLDQKEDEISHATQKEILRKKKDRLALMVAKMRRDADMSGTANKDEPRIWRR